MTIPKFYNDVDFNQNEAKNVKLPKVPALPATPFDTQHLVDTSGANDAFRLYLNGVWRTILTADATSNGIGLTDIEVSGTPALSKTLNGSVLALAIADAISGTSGLMSGSHYDLLNGATAANNSDSIVKRDASGGIAVATVTMATGTITGTPTGVNDIVNKSYVDTLVSSGVSAIDDFDASTNPDYPAASKGDLYHVTVAGKVGGVNGIDVEVGDSFKAKVDVVSGDQATVGNSWIIMQNNLSAATTTVSGHTRFATQTEVDSGILDNIAVSPATLAATGKTDIATGLIGDGTATSIVFTHNLQNQYCIVQVYDVATNAQVQVGVTLTDSVSVTLDFSVPPANNEFRVVVIG